MYSTAYFGCIRRWLPLKVKFVYRAIISDDSTLGVAIMTRKTPGLARAHTGALREGTPMKLGFFTMPIHPLDKDWRLSLREDREAFVLADELGFSEAYVGEHS